MKRMMLITMFTISMIIAGLLNNLYANYNPYFEYPALGRYNAFIANAGMGFSPTSGQYVPFVSVDLARLDLGFRYFTVGVSIFNLGMMPIELPHSMYNDSLGINVVSSMKTNIYTLEFFTLFVTIPIYLDTVQNNFGNAWGLFAEFRLNTGNMYDKERIYTPQCEIKLTGFYSVCQVWANAQFGFQDPKEVRFNMGVSFAVMDNWGALTLDQLGSILGGISMEALKTAGAVAEGMARQEAAKQEEERQRIMAESARRARFTSTDNSDDSSSSSSSGSSTESRDSGSHSSYDSDDDDDSYSSYDSDDDDDSYSSYDSDDDDDSYSSYDSDDDDDDSTSSYDSDDDDDSETTASTSSKNGSGLKFTQKIYEYTPDPGAAEREAQYEKNRQKERDRIRRQNKELEERMKTTSHSSNTGHNDDGEYGVETITR